jgi:hypothetical protein
MGLLAENGGLAGTRTLDQCLKRALLYQLSYQPTPHCEISGSHRRPQTFGIPSRTEGADQIKSAAKPNQQRFRAQAVLPGHSRLLRVTKLGTGRRRAEAALWRVANTEVPGTRSQECLRYALDHCF